MATGRIPTSANSPLTAKGDIFTFSTGSAKLAVGNDGETLVADSSTSTGLRYQGSLAAGRNFCINGGMDIWQRGTTFTATANLTYLADRWYNSTGSTLTVTRDTDVPTSPYFQYSLKMVGSSDNSIAMRIESANSIPLAGQTVTMSFYAKRTSGSGALDVRFYYPSATDNFTSVTQIGSTSVLSASPTSSWVRYQVSVAIGTNITTGLLILINNTGASTTFITGAQLELGSTATTFSRNASTIQGELAACKRYYYRRTAIDTYEALSQPFNASSTTRAYFQVVFPVTMRTQPTVFDYSTTYSLYRISDVVTFTTPTAFTLDTSGTSKDIGFFLADCASGLTQYRSYSLIGSTTTTDGYIGFGAEL
jgi:hypothetical protein